MNMDDFRNTIAQKEFDMDYDQLSSKEKEWVDDSIDYFYS